MAEQTEMDWIPVEEQVPEDTSRLSTLWLCLKSGNVVRGGYIKAPFDEVEDDGYWFDTEGHAVDGVTYWLRAKSAQSPHPPTR